MNQINIEAIRGLAITTAFFRMDFASDATIEDVIEADYWDEISASATSFMEWAGVDLPKPIDKYDIAQALWGMERGDVDSVLEG